MKKKTMILVVDNDNSNNIEIDFELKFIKSLTIKERFNLMINRTEELIHLLEKHGHKRIDTIIKRT